MSNQTHYTYRNAAKFLLELSDSENGVITSLSIQKLLYLAHGLMLAKYNEPLITGTTFQAWKYGPVIEPLYYDLKLFGSMTIKADSYFVEQWPSELCEEAQDCIRSVWRQFGNFSAFRLVDITHDDNGPWAEVYKSNVLGIEIDDDKIQQYFKTKLISN